jgi:hypothetical protein
LQLHVAGFVAVGACGHEGILAAARESMAGSSLPLNLKFHPC